MHPCPADEELTAGMQHGIQQPLPSHSVSGLHLQLQRLSCTHAGPSVCDGKPSVAASANPVQQPEDKASALPTTLCDPLLHSLMASFLERLGRDRWGWPAH